MEPDGRYFLRRIHEELAAAKRSVTTAARLRRYQLIEVYSARLEERGERAPISGQELAKLKDDCRETVE